MAKMLTQCPVCESAMQVTELTCSHCDTHIQSAFDTCRFCRLPAEHLAFVELFLRCEGNLSRVEKEMNLSYPTIRNRFAAALNALGFGSVTEPEVVSPIVSSTESERSQNQEAILQRRRAVLDSLADGSIGADEAAELLRELTV